MEKKSYHKIALYVGLLLMVTSIVLTMNSLHTINSSDNESILSIQNSVKYNYIESQIADLVYQFSLKKDNVNATLLQKNIRDIDDQIFVYEHQLVGRDQDLKSMPIVKTIWKEFKQQVNQQKVDELGIIYKLSAVQSSRERVSSQHLLKKQKEGEVKFFFLIVVGVSTGSLAFILILLAIYLEEKKEKQIRHMVKSLQESEKKAQESSRAKTMFLAIAGHELRTPLNGIIGLSELLRKSNMAEQETLFVDNIYHSGKSLLKMINNILEFAKIESGKIELENYEFSLSTVVNQIITTLSVKAYEKNIGLNYVIDKNVPRRLCGDASRLSQIIYNLVGNAVKFTAVGSVTLKINVQSVDENNAIHLQFLVEDTGIGMSEEQLQKLFLPFNVLQSKGTSGEIGSGLGLAISMQLARAMGGEIKVISEQGKGSCFSFEAIFASYSQEKIEREGPEIQLSEEHKEIIPIFHNGNAPTILVVDDNPTNLLMAQAMLERLGAKTIVASNGKEAIYECNHASIDLILMDCQMPIMDGFEATRELRKQRKNIPILAMTANTAHEDQEKCIESGMNGFIEKPILINILGEELVKALVPPANSVSSEVLKNLSLAIGYQGTTKVVQSFLADLTKTEDILKTYFDRKDLDGIHKIGHRNKSSAETVGARGLAELFKQLEKIDKIENAEVVNAKIRIASGVVKSKLIEHLTHIQ
jgi:signal transduction histidine kinase/CheY-like chemotaxis protein